MNKGGCLCGRVRYGVGAPVYQLICLCGQCQKIGGGFGVGSIVVPKGSITIEEGEEQLQNYAVESGGSGKGVIRRFCKHCGTHVFAENAEHPVTAITAGTLDDANLFKPDVAIWCESKRSFHRLPEGLPEFDQYPPQP